MSDSRKENMFLKLAAQSAKAAQAESPAPEAEETPPHAAAAPALARAPKPKPAPRAEAQPVVGKRSNPDYCQTLAYVPKTVRREVERALLDIDGLDYSSLVEELLRKWLKARGVTS